MHSWLIRVSLVAKCLHTNMTQDCFHDWFSVKTLCSQIDREGCQCCQTKVVRKQTLAFLALLGDATIVDVSGLSINFKPSWFTWTILMAYPKAKFKRNGDKATPFFKPFLRGNLSGKCFPSQTLLEVSFRHIFISLSSFMEIPNSIRTLNKTSLLTESYAFDVLLTMHLSKILVINQLNAQNLVL